MFGNLTTEDKGYSVTFNFEGLDLLKFKDLGEDEDKLNKCNYKDAFSPSLILQNIIYGINQVEDYKDALEYYLT